MERWRLELFDAGGVNPRLRWYGADSPMAERRFDRVEFDVLAAQVIASSRSLRPDLAAVGSQLYRWADGPTERWLTAERARQHPAMLYVDADERLRTLPWELLYDAGYLSVHPTRPLIPVRSASTRTYPPRGPVNRPLRLLFMASSPLDVEPVLDFEAEERVIIDAGKSRVEVVVEESGSLTGLAATLAMFGSDYFDVVHLSGHALIESGTPRFVMEGQTGGRHDVSVSDVAASIGGNWPRLIFLSGCSTGAAPADGTVASMAEALVEAGAPAVLGWALPVGDVAASHLAARLYGQLGLGADIPAAVTQARAGLLQNANPDWHLLRLYADRSELSNLVTPPATAGRRRLHARPASALFLDAQGRVKVADRRGFVGRRRDLQRLLGELRPSDPADGAQIALIHGMGGLGKSTVTARLLDRIATTHTQHAVWVGKIDDQQIRNLTDRLSLNDRTVETKINELVGDSALPLADRLRYVMAGPLADISCVFVFDDFESGNLEPTPAGGHQCTAEALEVLRAFGTAITRTSSASRVVITSRYDFPLPHELDTVRCSIGPLQGADLQKKLALTQTLGPTSGLPPATVDRAITAAAGVPRLLEALDDLLAVEQEAQPDLDALFTAIEQVEVEFREGLLLRQLLDAQPTEVRRAVALAAVYEIAVPLEAVLALSDDVGIRDHMLAATGVGLIQAGPHPHVGEVRYLVSSLVRPLLNGAPESLTADELQQAQQAAAAFLYDRWVRRDGE